jgi:hypothetical protein
MFDFRINGFDILPDFIGYLLFYLGASKLQHAHDRFAKAKPLCALMIFLSLPSLIEFQAGDIGERALLWTLFSVVLLTIDLTIVHAFCRGIEALAESQGVPELAAAARTRWTLYLILQVLVIVMFAGGFFIHFLAAALVIPLLIFSLVVLVLMMRLMIAAANRLQT